MRFAATTEFTFQSRHKGTASESLIGMLPLIFIRETKQLTGGVGDGPVRH